MVQRERAEKDATESTQLWQERTEELKMQEAQATRYLFLSVAEKYTPPVVMYCGGGGTLILSVAGVEARRGWRRGLCDLGSFDRSPNPNSNLYSALHHRGACIPATVGI